MFVCSRKLSVYHLIHHIRQFLEKTILLRRQLLRLLYTPTLLPTPTSNLNHLLINLFIPILLLLLIHPLQLLLSLIFLFQPTFLHLFLLLLLLFNLSLLLPDLLLLFLLLLMLLLQLGCLSIKICIFILFIQAICNCYGVIDIHVFFDVLHVF